jgi:hypothetical protein
LSNVPVVAVGLTADRTGRGRREGTSAGGIGVLVGVLVVMVMVIMVLMIIKGRRSGDDGSA